MLSLLSLISTGSGSFYYKNLFKKSVFYRLEMNRTDLMAQPLRAVQGVRRCRVGLDLPSHRADLSRGREELWRPGPCLPWYLGTRLCRVDPEKSRCSVFPSSWCFECSLLITSSFALLACLSTDKHEHRTKKSKRTFVKKWLTFF